MANKKGRETYRKIITSPELIAQINPQNVKLVDRFLKNFATKRSPKSVVVYKSNLNIFMCWNVLYNNNTFFTEIKKFEFMDFFDFCVTELKWSPNRFAQMHSSLCSFSDWIENIMDEYYPNFRNCVKKIEKPSKEAVRKKSVFSKEELNQLMSWLGEKNRVQEQCLLALMMGSGSRVSELVRFTTDVISKDNTAFEGLFLETMEGIKVKGRGVNGKSLIRYIIKDIFLPYYEKWLPERERIMRENNQNHNCIFIKDNGEPAQVSTIRSWIEKWDKALNKHLYPHSLRHFYCTYLLSIGLEKQLVQEIIGWQSGDLVDVYNDATAKDMKWKGLEKLKLALEQESMQEVLNEAENDLKEQTIN